MKNLTVKAELQKFMFETVFIIPIKDIVSKLENIEFRDCDIEWLNDKLYTYTDFAAKTFGKNFSKIDLVNNDGLLNEYKRNEFLKAFKKILSYFESFE
jgi:hypothetical protein